MTTMLILLLIAGMLLAAGCRTKTAPTPAVQGAAYQKIAPKDAKALLDANLAIILLDVRTPGEYAGSHIPHSRLLPLGDLPAKAASVLTDKNATIIVYCQSGGRSQQAAQALLGMGYTHVLDLGGIMSWPYGIERGK